MRSHANCRYPAPMSEPAKPTRRKQAPAVLTQPERTVKASVPLPASLHARLAGLALLRGQTLGQVAAEMIEQAVVASGVRLFLQAQAAEPSPADAEPAA